MSDNKWSQPTNPPPPLFLGEKERDFAKQVNDEVAERIIGQTIMYYGISYQHTKYNVYGEAIKKTFYPPVRVYALVEWNEMKETDDDYVDKKSKITVKFQKRRINEDQKLDVRVGDFVLYGDRTYEIVTTSESVNLYGQVDHRFEIAATCISTRKYNFKAE